MKTAQELIPIAGIITLCAPVHVELWTRARIVKLVVLCLFLVRRIHPGPVESATHRNKSKKDFGMFIRDEYVKVALLYRWLRLSCFRHH